MAAANQNSGVESNGGLSEDGDEHENKEHGDINKNQSKNIRRKAADVDFQYQCEWNDCKHHSSSMNEFNHHVSMHRRGYTQCLGSDQQAGAGVYVFFCQWRECNAHIEGQIDDFSRHVFYHTFHQYLKFLGDHIQKVEGLNSCMLDMQSRNVIPELPEKLMCRWLDCGMVYDNPYIFYSHVTHHCEDYPKGNDPKVKIICKWEGCSATTKSWYKMKEHIRSHTQAKVVACPTCGSLFASNTRYIDHLKRQSQDGDSVRFECSHCNGRFGSERLLRDHMRHHVNHCKCPLCDMTCHSPSAVRDHVRYRHSEERSHHCQQCHYRAKTALDLKRHSTTHVDKKLFSCRQPDCQQVFKFRHQLMKHYHDEHSNKEYGYECHICAKRFSRGTYLTLHLKDAHRYRWPSGHKKFRYKLHDDGLRRLQTIRYESIEVSQQVLGQRLTSTASIATAAFQQEEEEEGECADDEENENETASSTGRNWSLQVTGGRFKDQKRTQEQMENEVRPDRRRRPKAESNGSGNAVTVTGESAQLEDRTNFPWAAALSGPIESQINGASSFSVFGNMEGFKDLSRLNPSQWEHESCFSSTSIQTVPVVTGSVKHESDLLVTLTSESQSGSQSPMKYWGLTDVSLATPVKSVGLQAADSIIRSESMNQAWLADAVKTSLPPPGMAVQDGLASSRDTTENASDCPPAPADMPEPREAGCHLLEGATFLTRMDAEDDTGAVSLYQFYNLQMLGDVALSSQEKDQNLSP